MVCVWVCVVALVVGILVRRGGMVYALVHVRLKMMCQSED